MGPIALRFYKGKHKITSFTDEVQGWFRKIRALKLIFMSPFRKLEKKIGVALEKKKKYISKGEALRRLQRYCAYQERSHWEVRGKLLDLGIYGELLEEILAQLITDNFLNEERFACAYARGKFRMKQWGRRRIVQELRQREVSEYNIRKALEEISETDYVQTLETVLRKKATVSADGDPSTLRNRTAHYAIGRGFEPELVWDAITRLAL